jgi:hypothetical protein
MGLPRKQAAQEVECHGNVSVGGVVCVLSGHSKGTGPADQAAGLLLGRRVLCLAAKAHQPPLFRVVSTPTQTGRGKPVFGRIRGKTNVEKGGRFAFGCLSFLGAAVPRKPALLPQGGRFAKPAFVSFRGDFTLPEAAKTEHSGKTRLFFFLLAARGSGRFH